MDNKQFFKEAGFGMMMHFGLYSLIGGEWKGERAPGIGEWAQSYFRIPNAEYHELTKAFNPIFFNAEEYVTLAKEVGMKYLVVTAKHHEGFALYRSRASKFNSADATPAHRDFIEELANACARHGLKLGLYYSQELDWSHPHGGGYGFYSRSQVRNGIHTSRSNDWDFTDLAAKDYSICYEEKILPQVEEILTQYGDIFLVWFDTPFVITPEQSRNLYDLVKKLQPDCLVNSRIGNGIGDYRSTDDNQIAFDVAADAKPDSTAGSARQAEGKVRTGLYECPATMNDTWGWKSFDQNWKSADRLREIRARLNANGINYLLNVGPDNLGRIPAAAGEILRQMAADGQGRFE